MLMKTFRLLFLLSIYSIIFLTACNNKQCDSHYIGEDCDEEIPPSIITITDLLVTKYPTQDINGNSWDLLSDPDVYINISDFSGNFSVNTDGYFEDVDSQTISFADVNMTILAPLASYKLNIYDYDSLDNDDLIGQISRFELYIPGEDFPNRIILENASIRVILSLSYSW